MAFLLLTFAGSVSTLSQITFRCVAVSDMLYYNMVYYNKPGAFQDDHPAYLKMTRMCQNVV